jgi:hypothetical protein
MFHFGSKAAPPSKAHRRRFFAPPPPPRRHFSKSWALAEQQYSDRREQARGHRR